VSWLPDDPYPIANVEEWPDEWSGGAGAEAAFWRAADGIGRRIRRAAALANELGDVTGDLASAGIVDPTGDVVGTSYLLAAMSLAGPADLSALLAASGPVARVDRLEQVIGDIEALLQFRLARDDPSPFDT
jgi:Lon protease-like protein